MQIEQWQAVRPNDSNGDLSALTDGDDCSCESIWIKESILLRNIPIISVRGYIHVILVSGSSVLFGPEVHHGHCGKNPSLLMTQTSANCSQNCDPFCEVPQTCKYGGNENKESYFTHHFYCNCELDSCGIFLLMLRPESVSGEVSFCETYIT